MIIDTHIHLYDERYLEQLEEVIEEARKNDVGKMIVIGYDFESSKKAIELANQYPNLYATVGLHPSEVSKQENNNLDWIHELVKDSKVVAIGEIGLDYYWDKTHMELQKELFIKQIDIARQYNLPINVHSRSASNDTFTILKEHKIDGILHCYSQSVEMAREYVKLGYYLGIGGVVTFKNSKEIKEVVKEIDIKHIVVETDGPYLAPHPFRGKLNKPAYLTFVIEEIAKLKNMEISEVKEIIEKNTYDLFPSMR